MARPRTGLYHRVVGRVLVCALVVMLPLMASSPVPAAAPSSVPQARVIVQLEGRAAIAEVGGLPDASTLARIRSRQQAAASAITSALDGATVEREYTLAFNGLAVRIPEGAQAVEAIAALPGVLAVYPDEPFVPALFSSAEQIGATEVWAGLDDATTAGEGVKVAVLDSGIDISHAAFDPAGFSYPPGFPRGDVRYTTAKIPAARIYIRPDDPPLAGEQYPSPGANGSSHGTHLAGIVGGRPVTATYHGVDRTISGIAPAAWLLNYRLFYPSVSGREVVYTAELLAAIDDAVADGADVLLAGWASHSPVAPFASPVVAALEVAMDAGCIVVAAAGNDGPELGTASRVPGGSARAIAVGAVTKHSEIQTHFVDVTGPEPVLDTLKNGRYAPAEFGGQLAGPLGPVSYTPVELVSTSGDPYACDPLPSRTLGGRVAVIRRGECPFGDKAYYAQEAGAVAAVIVNDDDTLLPIACGGPYCGPGVIRIPVVLVTRTFGREIIAWGTLHHEDATLRLDPGGREISTEGDATSAFSARGPSFQRYLKPDIVAPGVAILSAALGSPTAVAQLSGTSVAAAHVAGAAALLRQLHPDWGHDRAKAALVGTASSAVTGLAEQLGSLQWGAGRIDIAAAAEAELVIDPPIASVGQVPAGTVLTSSLRLHDLRHAGETAAYSFSAVDQTGLRLSPPQRVTLSPGQDLAVEVRVQVESLASAGPAGATLVVAGPTGSVRVPFWAHVLNAAATENVLVIDNDFSFFEGYEDYAGLVIEALDEAGYGCHVWDADAHFDRPQTIPDLVDLQQYSVLIWVTGDNVHASGYFAVETPLTGRDQGIIAAYLEGGGRLLAMGKNLAEASDVNQNPDPTWGRSPLYHYYLGAHWLQGSLVGDDRQGALRAAGLPNTFLQGTELSLGRSPTDPSPQESVDEVGVGGTPDGADLGFVQPILAVTGGQPLGSGYVGVAKACEPTFAEPAPACTYRTVYYSFGPEGLGAESTLSLSDLLRRSFSWLTDAVSVSLADAVWGPNEPLVVRADAASSEGDLRSFEWQVETGSGTRQVTTAEPEITVRWDSHGLYAVSVAAVDSHFHRAIANAQVRVIAGGNSTLVASRSAANPGDLVTLTLVLRNSTGGPLEVAARLPVPPDTAYVSHDDGRFEQGALVLEAPLGPGAEETATLSVRVAEGAQGTIRAEAEFVSGGEVFGRSVEVLVGTRLRLPLVLHRATQVGR